MPLPNSKLPKPQTWDDCVSVVNDDRLFLILRVRLVELALTQTSTVAPKAIEMLLGLGQDNTDADLKDISTEVLIQARARARRFIQELQTDYANQNKSTEQSDELEF